MKEITKENAQALYALCLMWEQYCPAPYRHKYMTAGEAAEVVLQDYNLFKGDADIDWKRLEKFLD